MLFPIPTPLLRGLFRFMDEQDEEDEQNEPRGLFGHFGGEFGEDLPASAASASGSEPSQEAGTPWISDDPSQMSSLDYARRQAELALWGIATLGTGGQTIDPVTGKWKAAEGLSRLGNRMSGIAMSMPWGPGPVKGPPPRFAPGPATALPRSAPSLLFGGPQGDTAENAESQVYHLPPSDGGYYEDSDDEAEAKAREARAAERARENWRDICTTIWDREKRRCRNQYSYDTRDRKACEKRAFGRYEKCLLDKDETEEQWTDRDVDGGFQAKRPPKRWKYRRK